MFEKLEAALNEVKTKTKTRDDILSRNQKEIDKLNQEINDASNAVNTAQDKARDEADQVQNELKGILPALSQGRVRQN